MYKLLTEEGKEMVRREYVVRRAVVMLVGVMTVLVVGIVSLFPSYVLSNVRQKEVVEKSAVTVGNLSKDNTDLKTWLADTNRTLTLLSPQLDTDRPFEVFTEFLKLKPALVRVNNISWRRVEKENKIRLTAAGVAADRKSLLELESRLKSSDKFTDIVLPISNLAKDKDISFEITFSLKEL